MQRKLAAKQKHSVFGVWCVSVYKTNLRVFSLKKKTHIILIPIKCIAILNLATMSLHLRIPSHNGLGRLLRQQQRHSLTLRWSLQSSTAWLALCAPRRDQTKPGLLFFLAGWGVFPPSPWYKGSMGPWETRRRFSNTRKMLRIATPSKRWINGMSSPNSSELPSKNIKTSQHPSQKGLKIVSRVVDFWP